MTDTYLDHFKRSMDAFIKKIAERFSLSEDDVIAMIFLNFSTGRSLISDCADCPNFRAGRESMRIEIIQLLTDLEEEVKGRWFGSDPFSAGGYWILDGLIEELKDYV